jgi:anti-sigma regulatory factor (Ser/Thr protein kinase)
MSHDEAARIEALKQYRILDTDPEPGFDDLTVLASQICQTPLSLLTFVDEQRQWFKSRTGLPFSDTSRAVSFCAHAIQQREIMLVPDTLADPRFRDNPYVTGEPFIRFYAGAPIVSREGEALGTLCVLDYVPRTLTSEQVRGLDILRRQAEAQLELRRHLYEQRALVTDLRAAYEDVRRLSALIPFCSTCQFTMTIPADPAAIPRITDGVVRVLKERGWADDDVMKVELAVQEAVANAIRHGCRGDASKHLQCSVTCDDRGEVVITVRDPGTGFDPAKVGNPLDPANVLKPSGRGIFLINGLMDDVQFADGGREVQMRKKKVS